MRNHIVFLVLLQLFATQFGFAAINFAGCNKKMAASTTQCISEGLSVVYCTWNETPAKTCRKCKKCETFKTQCLIKELKQSQFDQCPQAQTLLRSLQRFG
ncbi:hypothetical protein P879_06063 [Paragonimus westermani]|uniref:TNFR-Cys domain-containing protein n=1 Tax=Paragonimus westermani TaxID=34504 RepID=A0A8T0DL81_9TREM|nr:hypothetical protein P879_06063 [Paragonimus westermani]